jgi:hypothetical protein
MRRWLNRFGFALIAFGVLWAAAMMPFWESAGVVGDGAPLGPPGISFLAILVGWVLLVGGQKS